MTNRNCVLTEEDHHAMDKFLESALAQFEQGVVTRSQVRGALAQVIAAVDQGNIGEARAWFSNIEQLKLAR